VNSLPKQTIIGILLASFFASHMAVSQSASTSKKTGTTAASAEKPAKEFGKSYDTLRPEQKKLVDDYVRRYNQTTGSKIVAHDAYDGARVSVRTTFDAVTHALIKADLTNAKGQSLGRAFDLVDAVDEIMGEETDVGGDRQFRLYVYLKPKAFEILGQSREFHRERDNTVYHKGFPVCYRLKNGPPSIQPNLVEAKNSYAREFRLVSVPPDMGQDEECIAIPDEEAGKKNKEKYYATVVRGMQGESRNKVMSLLWSQEGKYWKIVAIRIEDGTKGEMVPKALAKVPPVQKSEPAKLAEDPSAIKDITGFYSTWLVARKPADAVRYASTRSYSCGPAANQLKPADRIRLGLTRPLDKIPAKKDLSEMMFSSTPVNDLVRPVEHTNSKAFTIMAIPDQMAEGFLCQKRTTEPPDIEAKDAKYGKYYLSASQLNLDGEESAALLLLWSQEKTQWKVIAWLIDAP
jgi:hypothetical protein